MLIVNHQCLRVIIRFCGKAKQDVHALCRYLGASLEIVEDILKNTIIVKSTIVIYLLLDEDVIDDLQGFLDLFALPEKRYQDIDHPFIYKLYDVDKVIALIDLFLQILKRLFDLLSLSQLFYWVDDPLWIL